MFFIILGLTRNPKLEYLIIERIQLPFPFVEAAELPLTHKHLRLASLHI
jgi:hypothetical protein